MKNYILRLLGIPVLFSLLFFSCASTQVGMGLLPDNEYAVVTVKRVDSNTGGTFKVLIDNRNVGSVANGSEAKFLVKNGGHGIHIVAGIRQSPIIGFTANSNVLEFTTYFNAGYLQLEQTAGSPPSRIAGSYQNSGIEDAVNNAAVIIMDSFSRNVRLAIINVSSDDRDLSEFVAYELEFILVNNRYIVVDRSELDRVRMEQNFQLSGDVDDDTIVSIGKFAGADIVITGAITGSGETRRLRLRVLNTQTAQVMAVASERF